MPDRPDYFRCPNCKSVSFQQVRVPRPNGTTYLTMFFSCTVCTTMFLDPIAYTRGYEDRPHSPERKPVKASPYQSWAQINQRRRQRE
ncbi:hypothetical protein [Povalibacter sp.]|uniref:hypothetical protein n=1 Tax=Povalibacter sp. TaxID=1962978 RepID=UPI002F424C96